MNARRSKDTAARARRRRAATAFLATAAALGGLFTAPVGASVSEVKTFVLDADGRVPTSVAGSLAVHAGDVDAVVDLRVTNTSSQQQLGSMNITLPAPLRVVAAPDDAVPGGPVLELRSLALAPGASRTVTVTVAVDSCAAGAVDLAVVAKQSNDFNGTGNDVALAPGSDIRIDIAGPCRLAFGTQPANAERATTITSVPWSPGGSPITVGVRDAGGVDLATSSTAVVTLAATHPTVTAPGLGGTTTATAVGGVATFSAGPTLAVSAFGYRLIATSPGLTTSAPSAAFDIVDDRGACSTAGCSASASKGAASVSVTVGTGTTPGDLLVSIDAGDTPLFECADYPRRSGLSVSQFLFTGGDDRAVTFVTRIPDGSRPLKSYEACWAAPYTFATKSAALSVQGTKPGTTDPLYVGLLPDCARRAPVAPCVSGRSFDSRTRSVTLTVFATSADPWNY